MQTNLFKSKHTYLNANNANARYKYQRTEVVQREVKYSQVKHLYQKGILSLKALHYSILEMY